MIRLLLLLSIGLQLCIGCNKKNATIPSPIKQKYATLLHITPQTNYTIVEVKNPWNNKLPLATYILVAKHRPIPKSLPKGTIIKVPLSNVAVFTAVHCGALNMLGALPTLKATADSAYILNAVVRQYLHTNQIEDVGISFQPNIEKLVRLKPDAIFLSAMPETPQSIIQTNLPLIQCADYMESHPLGRVEWLRFWGLLFGKEQEAENLIQTITQRYLKLKNIAQQKVKHKPKVICDLPLSGTWYVPGGKSTIATLFKDAQVDYPFSNTSQTGSILKSKEALIKEGDAAIWLIKYWQKNSSITYKALQKAYPFVNYFKSWKNKKIWGCNTAYVPFYDEAPFQPDKLLLDILLLAHPEIQLAGKTSFYTPLQ